MTALQIKQKELIYLICFLMVTNPRRPTIARAQTELRRATGTWALEPADVERMWPGREGREFGVPSLEFGVRNPELGTGNLEQWQEATR